MPGFKGFKFIPKAESPEVLRKRRISLISMAIFLLLMIVISAVIGPPLVRSLSAENREQFREWVQSKGILGKLAFVGMIMLQVIVAIIPGEPFEIAAGYAFGPWQGTLLCLIGMGLGSLCISLFVKRWGIKAIEAFFPIDKIRSLKFLRNSKGLDALVFIIFLIPGTPKDLLTYCVWLTPMKFLPYLIISSVARIPSVISSALGGEALMNQEYTLALIVFGVTAALSAIGLIIYRKMTAKQTADESPEKE